MREPNVHVDESIEDRTPPVLKNLPDGVYRLTRLRQKEGPIGYTPVTSGNPYEGRLRIVARGNGPSLMIGNIITSWVLEAVQEDIDCYVEVITENSIYKLEGPISSDAVGKEEV